MANRPILASVGSLQTQIAFKSAARASARFASRQYQAQVSHLTTPTRSLTYSLPRRSDIAKDKDAPIENLDGDPSPSANASSSTSPPQNAPEMPWYLEVEPPSRPPVQEAAPLPPLPEDSPELLGPLMKYVYEEMGLDDLNLLDLRAFDPPPAIGQNLLMLFGTARSERHLHVASGRFVRWLRYNYKLEAEADGLLGPGELKTKLRRIRRKAKLLGTSTTAKPGGDDGLTTGWICVNLGTIGAEVDEAARFDESGKLSGFGNTAAGTGCTIVVQVMTEARRAELNLEKLWVESLARNKRQHETFTAAPSKSAGSSGRHPSQSLPGQKRSYTTGAAQRGSRLGSGCPAADLVSSGILNEVRRRILSYQLNADGGAPAAQYSTLLHSIFSPHISEARAEEQVSLVDDVLRTLSERQEDLLSNEVIVTVIESIAASGSKSPLLARVHKNLEDLMVIARLPCPTDVQLARLLRVYASLGDWDRFWSVWGLAPQSGRPRTEALYADMFEAVAATRNVPACKEALRTGIHTMSRESLSVFPGDRIYKAVLECISHVDPKALEAAVRIEQDRDQGASRSHMGQRQDHEEFVTMIYNLRLARK